MRLLLICFFLCGSLLTLSSLTMTADAQLTKPIPCPSFPTTAKELGDSSLVPGTSFKGFRLQGAGALYSVSLNPLSVSTSTIAVVYGIGWENDVWDNTSQRFYQKFGVALNAGPGGTVGTGLVGVVALTVSSQLLLGVKLPFKLVAGVAYNTGITSGSKWQVVTGPINGLNH
jgi:hypothetical protein